MLVAGEADGGDKGSALMDQNDEDEQMQPDRCRGVFWAAAGCCDGFEDGVDACFSMAARSFCA